MKTFTKRLLGLALVGLILGACSQTATFEDADLMNEQAVAKAGFKLDPFGENGNENAFVFLGAQPDCVNGFCIPSDRTLTNYVWLEGLPQQSKTAGQNSKSVNATVMLTILPNNMAYYTVTASSTKTLGNAQSAVYFSGSVGGNSFGSTTVQQGNFAQATPSTINFSYQSPQFDYSEIECGDSFDFTILESSFSDPVSFSGTRYLYEICGPECDEESFNYETSNENLDVVFSYNYSEEAEMTLTFTLPQAKIVLPTGATYIGADGKSYLVEGNGTNLTWTGRVSCSNENPTTFKFEFAADCGPSTANDGKANIWTNTEVKAINGEILVDDPNTPENEGPYSLKGSLSTIVYSGCLMR